MERTFAHDLLNSCDETVRVRGWLHTIRPFGQLNFVIIRDVTGLAQVVVSSSSTIAPCRFATAKSRRCFRFKLRSPMPTACLCTIGSGPLSTTLQTSSAPPLREEPSFLASIISVTPIPRIPFDEAQEIYFNRTGIDERQEPDLSPGAERELCRHAKEYFQTDFVFITDWKWIKRPFYSYPNPDNPELTHTFDLLCNGTEITSGGQRRNTFASMVEGIREKGMDPAAFTDYLDIFKYGMPPHGGFGVGLERLTMTFLSLKNIREASLFPSDPKRIAANRIKAKIFFGGENVRGEIIRLLKERGCEFEHTVHEATPTSEDSARVRGLRLEDGIKALVLLGKKSKKNLLVCVRSHAKLNMKAMQEACGEKCEFEKPEVIKERFGLEIGSIPPLADLPDF